MSGDFGGQENGS